jgi:cell filamentation protein
MSKKKIKYSVSGKEAEADILPNKPGYKTRAEIEQAELEGFLYAYAMLFDELSAKTKFNLRYVFKIHKLALGKLYSFAGKPRTVNISKGGFMFPPAKYLEQSLTDFEENVLKKLPAIYSSKDELIKAVAKVHAELLFIHPFREGNGRTARLLANLMCAKAGYKLLELENFSKEKFDDYVKAIQQAAGGNYMRMEKIIASLF